VLRLKRGVAEKKLVNRETKRPIMGWDKGQCGKRVDGSERWNLSSPGVGGGWGFFGWGGFGCWGGGVGGGVGGGGWVGSSA